MPPVITAVQHGIRGSVSATRQEKQIKSIRGLERQK